WTIDSANSRIVATGGNNALFLYSLIARADIDLLTVMDRSDAGGLGWRSVDTSNFYLLVVADAFSSVCSVNRATPYIVVANVHTQRAQATIAWTRGKYVQFRVTMLGGVITVSMDGVQILTYTDGSPLGAGQVGLFNNGGVTGSRYYQLWIQPKGDNLS